MAIFATLKRHVSIYFDHFNYSPGDFIPCEVCNSKAVDIHHIKARGMGGSDDRDTIENLMALCRSCHETKGDKKQHMDFLIECHKRKMNGNSTNKA